MPTEQARGIERGGNTMSEGDALYQTILENPEDDAPRLIYSDWLEEQGDTQRAQFIRIQCEQARAEPHSPLCRKLISRARRLYKPHWLHTLRGKALHAEMHRGFIHKITIYSKRFVTDAASIFATEPVREVRFADFTAVRGNVPVATLAVCPHLRRLTGLSISGSTVSGRMFDELLGGGHLAGLRKLNLIATSIEPDRFPQLLNASRLPHVDELHIGALPNAGPDWLEDLGGCNMLGQLKTFTVWNDSSSIQTLNAFLRLPDLKGLRTLGMTSRSTANMQDLPVPVLEAIALAPHLHNLADLDLAMTSTRDAALRQFCGNDQFRHLRRLNLPMNSLTGAGVQAILRAEHLRKLYSLNLDANHITGKSRWKELLREWCPEAIIRVN